MARNTRCESGKQSSVYFYECEDYSRVTVPLLLRWENNAAAADFLSRLPLEVTLNDYNNITEKIFYPSPALTTAGVPRGCAPVPGDITIYVPWNNVAIFCKSGSQSNDLIKIGRIDGDGINALNVPGNVAVKFERQ